MCHGSDVYKSTTTTSRLTAVRLPYTIIMIVVIIEKPMGEKRSKVGNLPIKIKHKREKGFFFI